MWTKIYLCFVLGLISFKVSSHIGEDEIKGLCEESLQKKRVTVKIDDQETYDWIMAIIKSEVDYHRKKDYYKTIVNDRLFSFSPLSFDDIAKKFGVTRQSVFLDTSVIRAMIRGRFLESNEDFSKEQKEQVLSLVATDFRIKKGRLARELGVSYQKIRLIIAELRGESRLAWVGPKQEGFWEILKKGEEPSVYDPKKEAVWFLMRGDPEISRAELAKVVDISLSTLDKIINRLKDEGRLIRSGPNTGGLWEALIKGEEPSGFNPYRERKETVWSLIKENSQITVDELVRKTNILIWVMVRIIDVLKDEGRLVRNGPKHKGRWEALQRGEEPSGSNLQEEWKEKILFLMTGNSRIRRRELAKEIGLSEGKIGRLIAELKREGRLARRGYGPNVSWEVLKKGAKPSNYNPQEERTKRVLSLMVENRRIRRKELAEKTGVSTGTIDNIIKELKEEGYLIRIGTINGYWKVLKKGYDIIQTKSPSNEYQEEDFMILTDQIQEEQLLQVSPVFSD